MQQQPQLLNLAAQPLQGHMQHMIPPPLLLPSQLSVANPLQRAVRARPLRFVLLSHAWIVRSSHQPTAGPTLELAKQSACRGQPATSALHLHMHACKGQPILSMVQQDGLTSQAQHARYMQMEQTVSSLSMPSQAGPQA